MLLTRSPLSPGPKSRFSLDLHVLSAPPAFVLSQDQTLREELVAGKRAGKRVSSLELELCLLPGSVWSEPRNRREKPSHLLTNERMDGNNLTTT